MEYNFMYETRLRVFTSLAVFALMRCARLESLPSPVVLIGTPLSLAMADRPLARSALQRM